MRAYIGQVKVKPVNPEASTQTNDNKPMDKIK